MDQARLLDRIAPIETVNGKARSYGYPSRPLANDETNRIYSIMGRKPDGPLPHFVSPRLQQRLGGHVLGPAADLQASLTVIHEEAAALAGAPALGQPGVPLFGPTTAEGIGSWAFLLADRKSARPHGSTAAGTSSTGLPWYKPILKHRAWRGSQGKAGFLYIRGHLLNHHLGGPAAPYNLVPLMGPATIDAAKVNSEHEQAMESIAKQAIMEMDRQVREEQEDSIRAAALYGRTGLEIAFVSYFVDVTNPRQPDRTGTGAAAAAADKLAAAMQQPGPDGLPINAKAPFTFAVLSSADGKSVAAAMRQVDSIATFAPDENGASSSAPAPSFHRVLKLLRANKKLWLFEDQNVPSILDMDVVIGRTDGTEKTHPYQLVNLLSDDPQNMMYREKVSS
jgi:hypothetical protein